MPYLLRKVRNQNAYMVKNSHTGQVHSHHTSRANALKQVRLLNAIDHGFIPRRGGARVSPVVKKMYDYLKSLYPKTTLLSVANEIIKLSKGGGGSRVSQIASYVISAIGIALAVALAIFIKSDETHQPEHESYHHHHTAPPQPSYNQPSDYEILGIPENSSLDVIKKAYRKKALKLHPDRGGDAEEFKILNNSYHNLLALHGGRRRRLYHHYY